MYRTLTFLFLLALVFSSEAAGQASLHSSCLRQARTAGLRGIDLRRLVSACERRGISPTPVADPSCKEVPNKALAADAAEAKLERATEQQRRSGAVCRIEEEMLQADKDMLDLIDRSPNHCNYPDSVIEFIRNNQNTMKRTGC